MADDGSDIFGKRLSRAVCVERTVDVITGAEEVSESSREVVEGWDGTLETVSMREARVLVCGHAWRSGEALARCELCSKEAGRTVYVCGACSVTCSGCGKTLCLKHTKPAPDGNRYCRKCYRIALRQLRTQRTAGRGTASGKAGLVSRFLEWW